MTLESCGNVALDESEFVDAMSGCRMYSVSNGTRVKVFMGKMGYVDAHKYYLTIVDMPTFEK